MSIMKPPVIFWLMRTFNFFMENPVKRLTGFGIEQKPDSQVREYTSQYPQKRLEFHPGAPARLRAVRKVNGPAGGEGRRFEQGIGAFCRKAVAGTVAARPLLPVHLPRGTASRRE
jgi:hypothetical protein